jgi:hypothetical protein
MRDKRRTLNVVKNVVGKDSSNTTHNTGHDSRPLHGLNVHTQLLLHCTVPEHGSRHSTSARQHAYLSVGTATARKQSTTNHLETEVNTSRRNKARHDPLLQLLLMNAAFVFAPCVCMNTQHTAASLQQQTSSGRQLRILVMQ